MKRQLLVSVCILSCLVAGVAYAASKTSFTVTPSEMKDGETKTFTDDGNTITVKRDGDSTTIRIEGAGETSKLSITRGDGMIRIHRDGDSLRSFVISPDRPRVQIDGWSFDGRSFDGLDLPKLREFRQQKAQTWFVCPKDRTMMRIPDAKEDGSYKCPVDGTTLEKRKGRGFAFFFDEDSLSTDL